MFNFKKKVNYYFINFKVVDSEQCCYGKMSFKSVVKEGDYVNGIIKNKNEKGFTSIRGCSEETKSLKVVPEITKITEKEYNVLKKFLNEKDEEEPCYSEEELARCMIPDITSDMLNDF